MGSGTLKFLHCADLHLDSPFSGLSDVSSSLGAFLRRATFSAFENAVSYALRNAVDLFLISGDVYDGEDRSIRAQSFFLDQLKRLSDAGIPSFLVHGNHDPLSGWELDRDLPHLAFRFGAEVESLPLTVRGERVGTVHGCSFGERDVGENLALRFAGCRGEGVNIALLHCNVGGRKGHENYAPCSIDDLRAAGMDYWALGHVHAAEVLSHDPMIVYPGNIQGRHVGETGKKGVFCGTLALGGGPGKVSSQAAAGRGSLEFVPCDAVRWRKETLSIEGMHRDEEFFVALERLKESVRGDGAGRPVLLRVAVSGRGKLHALLRRPGLLAGAGGVAETLNESEEGRGDFVHIESIVDTTAPPFDMETLTSGDHFVGDFLKEIAAFERSGAMKDGLMDILAVKGVREKLSGEVFARLDSLSDEQISALLRKGAALALAGLLEGEDDE